MPVDIDRFEGDDPIGELTTSERILRFLASHDTQAFTRREIAEAIDRDAETVGTNLNRLKDRGLVRHRTPYWAFTDDREAARATLTDRYDDEFVASLVGDAKAGERADNDRGDTETARGRRPEPGSTREAHRTVTEVYFDGVSDRFGDAVEALYLFGSVARGDETDSSDVDVLAVIDTDADYATVDDGLLDLAYEVQLEHEVRIEVHSIPADEFADRRDRGDPFVRRVLAEAEASG